MSNNEDANQGQSTMQAKVAAQFTAKRKVLLVCVAGIGILLTISFLKLASHSPHDKVVKSHSQSKDDQASILSMLPGFPTLSEPARQSKVGRFNLSSIRKMITRPRFIIVASVVLVVIIAAISVTLYLVLRTDEPSALSVEGKASLINPLAAPNALEGKKEAAPNALEGKKEAALNVLEVKKEAAPPSHSEESSFRWSSLITAFIMIVLFGAGLFLLFKFGTELDIKIKLAVLLVLLTIFFLFIRFEDVIMPYLTWLPKKLVIMAADSANEG